MKFLCMMWQHIEETKRNDDVTLFDVPWIIKNKYAKYSFPFQRNTKKKERKKRCDACVCMRFVGAKCPFTNKIRM